MAVRLSDEKRAELWARAELNAWTQTEVQRRLKLNRGTISGILKRGAKYSLAAAKFDDWLQKYADTPAFELADAPRLEPLDVPEALAEKFTWIAGVLTTDDIDADEKIEEFVRLIRQFHASIESYAAELKIAYNRRG